MLMALEPQVYMFDEPTAGMSVDEVPVILDLIRALKATASKTILLVEHKMDVVRELADRIIVLHNGQLVADGEPAEVIASPIVQEAYLGVAPQAEAGMSEPDNRCSRSPACTRTSARTTSCTASTSTVPRGAAHDAARPQRRRQDDDAAHDHGPVARVAGPRSTLRRRSDITARCATPGDRRAGHRLRAREHGHLRRPHGEREHAARGARRAQLARSTTRGCEWIFGLFPALKKFWHHPAGKLSGGQKQMLAIVARDRRAARLLLIDEPSKGLAPAIIHNLIDAFAS